VKELSASASATVRATPKACTDLLAAVDRYPAWFPEVIRQAEVVERAPDGTPVRARATVHLSLGPIARDFNLLLAVAIDPGARVTLKRVPHDPSDEERFELGWGVGVGPPTRLQLDLEAYVDVPRFAPVGALGDQLARAFVDAAKRELDGSSPNASASSS
jgi:hypothetical protein